MYGTRSIYVLMTLSMCPFVWLLFTMDWLTDGRALWLAAGSAVTGGAMAWALMQAHRAGRLMPNRCGNCAGPMVALRRGELVGRDGTPESGGHAWRCPHCGRLA